MNPATKQALLYAFGIVCGAATAAFCLANMLFGLHHFIG